PVARHRAAAVPDRCGAGLELRGPGRKHGGRRGRLGAWRHAGLVEAATGWRGCTFTVPHSDRSAGPPRGTVAAPAGAAGYRLLPAVDRRPRWARPIRRPGSVNGPR